MLREWSDIRSRELKYINTGNKTFAAQYRAMSADEKRAVLDAREAAFYDKHEGKINEGRKPNIAGIGREPPPRARGRLLHLWFASDTEVKCYCRVMYLITWSTKEPVNIKLCDGPFLGDQGEAIA